MTAHSKRHRALKRQCLALGIALTGGLCGCAFEPESLSVESNHTVRPLQPNLVINPQRTRERESLIYFAHMTDFHVMDEMSPLRIEPVDAAPVANYLYAAAWRPHESLSAQLLSLAIKSANAHATSSVVQGSGRSASLEFALITGDLIDNLQHNEAQLVIDVLSGRPADPYSGQLIGAEQPCPGASTATTAALNARVTARRYIGVQDYASYPPTAPADRRVTFWDPAALPPDSILPKFPRYQLPRQDSLLDAAQVPLVSAALSVPIFVTRGNHDSLVQGFYPPWLLEKLYHLQSKGLGATGCRKVYPSIELDPYSKPFAAGPIDPEETTAAMKKLYDLAGSDTVGVFVPPDSRRQLITSPDYPALFDGFPHRAGYSFVSAEERKVSKGYAHYYAFSPKPGLKLISLDTNRPSSGPDGSLSNPQFQWLRKELTTTPADTLVVVFAHHPLRALNNSLAPGCSPPDPRCPGDPRPWDPNRLGCPLNSEGELDCTAPMSMDAPASNLRDLLLRHPQVVLYLTGHTHTNHIEPYVSPRGNGFWAVTTASIIDWPQQSRTLEILDNHDGSLSIITNLVDLLTAPAASHELGALAHRLARLDVEWREGPGRDAAGRMVEGTNIDGDVELLLIDPRSSIP